MSSSYDHDAYLEGYPEGIEKHFWHIARNDCLQRLLTSMIEPNELVLDVGCGMGVATAFLRARGVNCIGVELGEAPVAGAVKEFVHTGTSVFELPQGLREQVGVVLLLDVLEHIEQRTQFLNQLRQALPNCKQLLVTVPARQELWSNYDDYWGHQLRYSRPALRDELEAGGYQVLRSRYLFHSIYWIALFMNMLRLRRSEQFQPPARNALLSGLHRILGAWAVLENRYLPCGLVGSSLVCVARAKTDDA